MRWREDLLTKNLCMSLCVCCLSICRDHGCLSNPQWQPTICWSMPASSNDRLLTKLAGTTCLLGRKALAIRWQALHSALLLFISFIWTPARHIHVRREMDVCIWSPTRSAPRAGDIVLALRCVTMNDETFICPELKPNAWSISSWISSYPWRPTLIQQSQVV